MSEAERVSVLRLDDLRSKKFSAESLQVVIDFAGSIRDGADIPIAFHHYCYPLDIDRLDLWEDLQFTAQMDGSPRIYNFTTDYEPLKKVAEAIYEIWSELPDVPSEGYSWAEGVTVLAKFELDTYLLANPRCIDRQTRIILPRKESEQFRSKLRDIFGTNPIAMKCLFGPSL